MNYFVDFIVIESNVMKNITMVLKIEKQNVVPYEHKYYECILLPILFFNRLNYVTILFNCLLM